MNVRLIYYPEAALLPPLLAALGFGPRQEDPAHEDAGDEAVLADDDAVHLAALAHVLLQPAIPTMRSNTLGTSLSFTGTLVHFFKKPLSANMFFPTAPNTSGLPTPRTKKPTTACTLPSTNSDRMNLHRIRTPYLPPWNSPWPSPAHLPVLHQDLGVLLQETDLAERI